MKRILAIFLLVVLVRTCLVAQASFDYSPKALKSELAKINSKEVTLVEIPLSAELARTVRVGKYYVVSDPAPFSNVKYVYVGRVNTCRAGGCSISQHASEEGASEFFDYFMFFNSIGAVQKVKVYDYQATHGQEITATNWLKQFKDYDTKKELIVGRNIDALSGATISVDATVFDIELKTKILQRIM
jgi:Na+-translocating ferredoxin:NAD+ oxidoreductase RnfG subunit